MANKKFELERVLVYRREVEKLRQQELATARLGLDKANLQLQREEQHVELLTHEFHQSQKNIGCIDDLRMYSDFFSRKRDEIKQQKERIEVLDQVMNERRADLVEASKDKKVLESLKDKKAEEFKMEMAAKDRNFLDEISIQKKVKYS